MKKYDIVRSEGGATWVCAIGLSASDAKDMMDFYKQDTMSAGKKWEIRSGKTYFDIGTDFEYALYIVDHGSVK